MSNSTISGPNPSPTRVKICGITNLDDAFLAAEAGADYLGFIFYPPSKRATTPLAAQDIVSQLRDRPDVPLLVGVFVNETAADMALILANCDLDLAQLSGDETPNLIGDPESPIFGRSYKALRPATFDEGEAEAEWYFPSQTLPGQPSLLLDAQHASLYGGTGQVADWTVAAQLAENISGLMLAGGLNADNVAAAVSQVKPFAVDVASGIEARPGCKDPKLVRSFIANAKSAETDPETTAQ